MKSKKTKSTPKLTQKQREYDKQVKYWENRLKNKAKAINKRGFIPLENLFPEKPAKRLKSYIEALKERVENIYDYAYYVKQETGEYFTGLQRRGQERRQAAEKAVISRRQKDAVRQMEQFQRDFKKFYDEYRDEIESGEYLRLPNQEPVPFPEPERPPIPQPRPPEEITRIESREPTPEEREILPSESMTILDRVYSEIERWQPEVRWSNELSELKREDVDSLGSIIDGAIRELGKLQVARNLASCAEEFESLCIEVMYVSGSKYKETGREGIRTKLDKIGRMVWGRPLTVVESKAIFEQSERFNESE